MRRLSGVTCEPSQANSSVAKWLESLGDFHVKTSAWPEDKPESMATDPACFSRSSGLFASWNPSIGSFLRTSRQSSIFQQEEPFSENLPRSGSMRNGELYERQTLAQATAGTGLGCWHTPKANETSEAAGTFVARNGDRGEHCTSGLTGQVGRWPTARAEDSESCGNHSGGRSLSAEEVNAKGQTVKGKRQVDLRNLAELWPTQAWRTPATRDFHQGGPRLEKISERQTSLLDQAKQWPTPTTRDMKSPDLEGSGNFERKMGAGFTIDLNSTSANWPTAQSRDWKSGQTSQETADKNARPLSEVATTFPCSRPALTTSTPGQRSSYDILISLLPPVEDRELNPKFVEWLMGWPVGWSDCGRLGMEWCRFRRQWRFDY